MSSQALDAAALAAATPPERDRVVDFVRVAAVGVVVVGHWLLAAVTWDADGLHGRNLLGVVGWSHWLTWVFQVMPLVFVAGGAANAASWTSSQRRGTSYADWLQGRLRRLVRPAAVLVAVWTVGLALAQAAGADSDSLHAAARLIVMPLWFLAVYVPVVAVTPLSLAARRRWGLRSAAVLLALVAAADVAVLQGHDWVGWTSYAWVWLLAHELGFWWRETRLDRRTSALLTAAGLGALALLTAVGGYPVSMVGVPGERTNTSPPSLALVALAVAHFGVLSLLRPRLERWLERPQVWRRVVVANGMVMTAYLWHMTALAAGVVGLLATGWFPQDDPGSGTWWAWRPAWIAALGLILVPLLLLFARIEARPPAPTRQRRPSARRTLATPAAAGLATVLSAAFVHLALAGLPVL
ncbi:MAG TPA: acyltransferase family protein [Acidimicrobiales bacterium]|nr:acyltransferase family protein [Acidimicrobiales bacterium]